VRGARVSAKPARPAWSWACLGTWAVVRSTIFVSRCQLVGNSVNDGLAGCSDVKWASRWDVYLQMQWQDDEIHWFSIVNSSVRDLPSAPPPLISRPPAASSPRSHSCLLGLLSHSLLSKSMQIEGICRARASEGAGIHSNTTPLLELSMCTDAVAHVACAHVDLARGMSHVLTWHVLMWHVACAHMARGMCSCGMRHVACRMCSCGTWHVLMWHAARGMSHVLMWHVACALDGCM